MKERLYFLSKREVHFFEALCETIVPNGPDPTIDPGSLTVGGIEYIDSELADMPAERQSYFRQAMADLEKLCQSTFSQNLADLDLEQRQTVLKQFFLDPGTREKMFDLRSIVLESFYSDYRSPGYDGITAWEYLDFGGKRISDVKKDWRFLRVWRESSEG